MCRPSRARSSSTTFGSPRQNAIVPPTSSVTIWVTRASEWASGRNMKTDLLVPAPNSSSSSYIRAVAITFACVVTHPFGGPVVPEV